MKVRAEITKTRQDEPVDDDEELEAALSVGLPLIIVKDDDTQGVPKKVCH